MTNFFLFFIFKNHNAKKKKHISDSSFWREMRANTIVYVFIIKLLKKAAPRTNARIHECILTSFYFLCSYLCLLKPPPPGIEHLRRLYISSSLSLFFIISLFSVSFTLFLSLSFFNALSCSLSLSLSRSLSVSLSLSLSLSLCLDTLPSPIFL